MYGQAGILPTSGGGSFSDFPLLSSKIHYDLVDVQSLATFVLTYASNASVAVDANYVCPLPSDASVCSFRAVIDGSRTIKGIVKDKTKARAEYDAAVAQGKTAALLEQNNVEVFQVSLGNIHPKQVIEIYISLASLITGNGELDSLRLVFPSVITPRYGTPPNELLSLASRVRPIKSALDFSVSIQMMSHIKTITSPSHPISLTLGSSELDSEHDFDPFRAHVTLTSQDHLDKDIVVVITCQGIDRPRCTVESFSPEEGGQEFTDAYSLTLVPRFEIPPLPKQEYIFLVDRSGSMGPKMLAVRSALQVMLRSLPSDNTSFNIFSFGSRYDSLWPSSVAYGAESLKLAASYVDAMSANYGGTEIRNALDAVLQTHTKSGDVPLTVFVLTDGETYDLNGVQSTIAEHVNRYLDKENFLRIFCMGIGNSVSKAMCDLIARTGRGAVVYVGEDEKPDKKLITLLRAARGPIITNISVDWGVGKEETHLDDDDFELVPSQSKNVTTPLSLFDEKAAPKDNVTLGPSTDIKLPSPPKIQQAPTCASLSSLYPGFRTSIFAIVRRDHEGNSAPSKAVHVKGIVQGRAVELEVPVIPAMAPGATMTESSEHGKVKFIHVLAARALVQRFEDEGKKDGVMSDILKAEVLRVAVRYGIASSETSFVAVDEEGAPVAVAETPKAEDVGTRVHSLTGVSFRPTAAPESSGGAVSVDSVLNSFFDSLLPSRRGSGVPGVTYSRRGSARAKKCHSTDDSSMSFGSMEPTPTGSQLPPLRSSGASFMSSQLRGGGTSEDALQSQDLPLSIGSIARYQTFEGSFDCSPDIYKLVVKKNALPALPDALRQLQGTLDLDTIWCTILCIVFIQTKFPDDEAVWEVIVEKGERWVIDTFTGSGVGGVSALIDTLKQEAKKYIV